VPSPATTPVNVPFTKSIRWKLLRTLILSMLLVIVLAMVLLAMVNGRQQREAYEADFRIIGEMLDSYLTPALEFDDPATAGTVLRGLSGNPEVLGARVHVDDKVFARYSRRDFDPPAGIVPNTFVRKGNHLFYSKPFSFFRGLDEDPSTATLLLVGDMGEINAPYNRQLLSVLSAILLSAFLGLAFAWRGMNGIMRPVRR